jgi:hypothetical protein
VSITAGVSLLLAAAGALFMSGQIDAQVESNRRAIERVEFHLTREVARLESVQNRSIEKQDERFTRLWEAMQSMRGDVHFLRERAAELLPVPWTRR